MDRDALPVVLVDVDEVLFPFAHSYDRWLQQVRGTGLNPAYVHRYEIAAAAGSDHDRLVVRFLNDPVTVEDQLPVGGSRAAIALLAEQFRVIACTSRHGADEGEATRAWLQRHVPQVEGVVFTRHERGGPSRSKASIACALNALALIDDSDEHLALLPSTCRGVLLARPAGLPSGLDAVEWPDALHLILGSSRPTPEPGESSS